MKVIRADEHVGDQPTAQAAQPALMAETLYAGPMDSGNVWSGASTPLSGAQDPRRQRRPTALSPRADGTHVVPAGRRVLIVDDETSLLRTLGTNLRRRGYCVTFATTGRQALVEAERCRADAVILELGLPDINGMEVLARVRCWTSAPVLVLSTRTSEIQKVAALDAGASDYITKPFGMEELLARLRAALRDVRRGNDQPVVKTEHFTIDLLARQVLRDGRPVPLTRTEWRIVQLLARNPGRLITQSLLLSEIWGLQDQANNYIRVFMVTIRRKLEPDPAHPRYFVTEPGCGVRFLPSGWPPPEAGAPDMSQRQAGPAAS